MSLELCNKEENFGGPLKRMAKQRKLAPSKAGNLLPRDPGRRDREGRRWSSEGGLIFALWPSGKYFKHFYLNCVS